MKKLLSLFLSIFFVFVSAVPTLAYQKQGSTSKEAQDSVICYNLGNHVQVVTERSGDSSVAKVYKNDILIQSSRASATNKTIATTVYDQSLKTNSAGKTQYQENGFLITVTHSPVSSEKISPALANRAATLSRDYNDEPVDNSGLSQSGYRDGYYLLGKDSLTEAPNVMGYLYRKYKRIYDGETSTHTWTIRDTASTVSAYYGLISQNLVGVVLGILQFAYNEYLDFNQSIKLETYTFNYDYRVRVNGTIYYDNGFRGKDYWLIYNTTTGTKKYDFKYDSSPSVGGTNFDMIQTGIENYLMR